MDISTSSLSVIGHVNGNGLSCLAGFTLMGALCFCGFLVELDVVGSCGTSPGGGICGVGSTFSAATSTSTSIVSEVGPIYLCACDEGKAFSGVKSDSCDGGVK